MKLSSVLCVAALASALTLCAAIPLPQEAIDASEQLRNMKRDGEIHTLVPIAEGENLPFVVFHGLGDACKNSGMKHFVSNIASSIDREGICIESGASNDSWLVNFPKQIEASCAAIKANEKLANGYNIVTLSQGGIAARGVLQQCDGPPIKNIVSFGSPNAGTASMPGCSKGFICNTVNFFIKLGVYTKLAQDHIGPANYYKDPTALSKYMKGNKFLPDLNNEKDTKNPQYQDRIKALKSYVLVKFVSDTVINPPETAHFGYWADGGRKDIVNLADSPMYKEDWLGLKELDANKALVMFDNPGEHLQIKADVLAKCVVYLQ